LFGGGFDLPAGAVALSQALGAVRPWLDGAAVGLAVFLAALGIKAMDDLLDEPERPSYQGSDARTAVYVASALVAACGLAPRTAVSLFLAAYALGMAPVPERRLPTGLPSWVEGVGALVLSAILAGPGQTAGSFGLMAGIQAVDDYRDRAVDSSQGRANIALAAGPVPTLVIAAVTCTLALVFSPAKVLASVPVVLALVVLPPHSPGTVRRVVDQVRFRTAAVAVGSVVLGAVGQVFVGAGLLSGAGEPGAPPGGADTLTGLWTWVLPVALATLLLGGLSVVNLAYRRGVARGRRRGREAEKALQALRARAEAFERAGRGTGPGRHR